MRENQEATSTKLSQIAILIAGEPFPSQCIDWTKYLLSERLEIY